MRTLILLLALSGCRVVYPGDGRLVIVEIDRDLDACLGPAVRAGIRYWDAVGARLRTEDQLLGSESAEAASAPKLLVNGDACESIGNDLDPNADIAEYRYDGSVHLALHVWDENMQSFAPAAVIAHEFGHAIGLDHVTSRDAIMFKNAFPRENLSAADEREHQRMWK